MTKALRKIGQLVTFCLVLGTGNLMAQTALTIPANPKMEMAKERFESAHDVTLSNAEFNEKLQASDANLAEWNDVLATYTRDEIKAELQANPTRITGNGVESDSDYFFIRKIVQRLQRSMN